jgi:uncharacterized phage protein (TIGR02218 family)
LRAGLYDKAEVRVYLVNWQATAERHFLRVGHIGEVTREDGAFRAEVRGLAAELDQPQGRVFRHTCDADLGDSRCGIDLGDADFHGAGTVAVVNDRRRFVVSGLDGFDADWFDRGRLSWTSGANVGLAAEVKSHRQTVAGVEIELWQPAARDIADGDGFSVTAGCDKLFGTCRRKFDNVVNFRGFPHMPGTDFALGYARPGRGNDGKAVVE